MKSLIRFGLMTFGIVFIIVGILGLFLPLLQGFLFLIPGIYLLTITSTRCKALLERILSKYPKIKKMYETHVARFEKMWNKGSDSHQ